MSKFKVIETLYVDDKSAHVAHEMMDELEFEQYLTYLEQMGIIYATRLDKATNTHYIDDYI